MRESASFSDTHPETFYDIQEDKTANLFYLLLVMTGLYCTFFWAAYLLLYVNVFDVDGSNGLPLWTFEARVALGIGVLLALVHFVTAYTRDLRPELVRLGVKQPDPDDRYHRIYANVLDEMLVATGRTDLEGYVLPTRYRTALSLEDRERAAIIVTEGALGVLDRHEIQAVVAHEMAHVAYGDTGVKTFVHKLVSFVDSINDDALESETTAFGLRSKRGGFGASAIILLSYVYEFLLRLLRTTISKERERRADATAVEYSRNPEALASALHKLGLYYRESTLSSLHYRGFRYLSRSDYESLQIVPVNVGGHGEGFFNNLFDTHPSIEERIDTLMALAGSSRAVLEDGLPESGTEPYYANQVTTGEGAPVSNQTFWVQQGENTEGPFSFDELLEDDRFDETTRIGFSEDGPMEPMGSLSLFQYLFSLADRGDLNRDCPECGGPLREDEYLGVPLVTCPVCGGVGLTEERMLRVACRYQTGQSESSEALEELSHTPAYGQQPEEEFELRQNCPECDSGFEKSYYADRTSLIVDTCPGCGFIWFENGELNQACKLV